MGKRKFKPRSKTVTASFFTDHAHRWPEAGEPMAYAMACVEVIANCSPRGRELCRKGCNRVGAEMPHAACLFLSGGGTPRRKTLDLVQEWL
jgi:hypothetical protein